MLQEEAVLQEETVLQEEAVLSESLPGAQVLGQMSAVLLELILERRTKINFE